MHRKQLAIVDEHEVFRRGVQSVLADDPWIEVVHEAPGGTPPSRCDAVVASPRACLDLDPTVPVVVCWGVSDPPLTADRPRMAIVERDRVGSDELVAAVRALSAGLRLDHGITNGGTDLDRRRRHILALLAEGADTRGISESLFYSERTVKGLIRDIEHQLSARNRAQAVAKGIRLGLI